MMPATRKDPPPKVESASMTFSSEVDCCGPTDSFGNTLEVFTQDGGGGAYLVIKTERWAIDPEGIDEFVAMLRRVADLVPTGED